MVERFKQTQAENIDNIKNIMEEVLELTLEGIPFRVLFDGMEGMGFHEHDIRSAFLSLANVNRIDLTTERNVVLIPKPSEQQ